jgi:ABC-type uncharacterized transport system substrate-binding protein
MTNFISKSNYLVLFICIQFFLISTGCTNPGVEKKKVVYVNSYHKGFPPTDDITQGVFEGLPADSFEIAAYFMDTKRNSSEAYIKKRAEELLDSIRKEKPEVLIVSDDNAMKYLVVPNFQGDPLPIVFCGVNWSAEQYDLSGCNITGILELLPVVDLVQTMKPYYPGMKKLLVLNENTTTSRKTSPLLDTLLGNIGIEVTQELVDDFASWKSVFIEANLNYDIIYLQTRGAIKDWDHEEAIRHIDLHIKIPLVTCEEFMMPYAVFGLTQVSKEQGMIAATKAKLILNGASPAELPISRNNMTNAWINSSLAEKISFTPDKELLKKVKKIE